MDLKTNTEALSAFCRRWKIKTLELFGSALRQDFDAGSDIDILVTFEEDAEWSLFEHAAMQEELSAIFGRHVDLVSRRAIERSRNWIRRERILGSAEPLYGSR